MKNFSIWCACAVVALLSIVFFVGSTPDEEEFRFAVLSAWLHVDALRHGRVFDFWTSTLGFGVPQPFSPTFLWHPLLPLLAFVSPVTWARVVLVAHTLLGAAGMWRLATRLRVTPATSAVCVSTFLLAAPMQNYALTDFWLSHYIVWTSAPWLLLIAYRLLDADARALPFWSIAAGLCAGLVIANTNPGHILVYGTIAGAVAIVHWRRVVPRAPWIALAGLIAAAIAAPGLIQLAQERRLFAPDLGSANAPAPLPAWAGWNVLFSPMPFVDARIEPSRTLLFGGPFAVLAMIGCVRLARRHPDLVLVVATSAILLFTTFPSLPLLSARYQFRDPLTLAAIPLAGLALDRLFGGRRWTAEAVRTMQLAALIIAVLPAVSDAWVDDAKRAEWFVAAAGKNDTAERLLQLARPAGRTVFSPAIDDEIFETTPSTDGIGVNALAYRGLPVVNGWFKGVSTASIWPDERMLYGRIRAPRQLIESSLVLDVLGIRYVVAGPGETVARDLRRIGDIPKRVGLSLVLYENADAWPGAFVLNAAVEQIPVGPIPDCGSDRLLCRDVGALAGMRVPDDPIVAGRDGELSVRLFAASSPQLLVVSQMFRPEWVATTGDARLTTVAIAGGLLGVRVPAGISSVQLRYRPVNLIVATAAAWCTLLAAIVALIALRTRAASREAEPPGDDVLLLGR
jgi:hypothetical protein